MSTNRIILDSAEVFMKGFQPTYKPLYPLFMGKAQAYSEEVGQVDFKRITAVGDIRTGHITPKDTSIKALSAMSKTKSYKKYFMANKYTQSNLQDKSGVEDVVGQVLDEANKFQDELFLLGEGTSESTMINNGLFWSDDPNYNYLSTPETLTDAEALHTSVMETVAVADEVAGKKAIIFYGTDCLPIFDSVYESAPVPFKTVLQQVIPGYELVKMPAAVTPASTNGWIIANLDQVKLHHSALPKLLAQGINDEDLYSWHNFLQASMMLECLVPNAIVRQIAST